MSDDDDILPDETIARLRERMARVEGQQVAMLQRLERGAGTMDELRRLVADSHTQLTRNAAADRIECQQTFRAIREDMKPKPMTPKRALSWVFGAGVPVVALVGGAAMWLLSMRDSTRDATKAAEGANGAVHSIKADLRQMERKQAEAAGETRALQVGQDRVEDKLDRLLGRFGLKKDEE